MGTYPRLLEPLEVGQTRLRNRMVMGAMHTRLETLDRPVERLVEFYRARARGEIGLILTGGFAPHPNGQMDPESSVLDTRESLEEFGHREITRAVHDEGAKIVLQILHAGRYAKVPGCVGPTDVRARINRFEPRALTTSEVHEIVQQFATTARLAQEGGYDGVEIMGSEGYLLNEFVSEETNTRTDEWGGDRDGRFKLPLDIIRAIRQATGPDFLIVYRISSIDLVPRGLVGEEVVDLARRVDAAGADVINTGIGWHESTVPTMAASVPRAAWTFAIQKVKDAVGIPVIASNRINTPDVAEELLADGVADLVSMARPLLADPDFARKVREGRDEEICTCIGCNQACLDAIFTDRAATCMVNPKGGREIDFLLPMPTTRTRVAVVGAGPAGLAYAVNAAERGQSVTLFDRAPEIGGQLNMARRVPGKREFNEALRYFRAMLDKLRVDVHLNTDVTVADLAGFDTVVIATGVTPRIPDVEGIDHPKVLSYVDVLTGAVTPGASVAIIGAGGIGFDVAEFLLGEESESLEPKAFADAWQVDQTLEQPGGLLGHGRRDRGPAGRQVTLLQRKPERLGRTLGKSTGWILKSRLKHAGLQEVSGATYERIDDEGLHYTVDGQTTVLPVDHVIICAGQESERSLFDEMVAAGITPVLIGGAHSAGELDAVAAINQATRAAHQLETTH